MKTPRKGIKGLKMKSPNIDVERDRVKSLIGLSLANMPAIMGSEKFIKGVKQKFSKKKKDMDVPESKKLCLEAGISKRRCAAIMKSGRGAPRYVRGERLEKIGEEFNLSDYSSVNNAISRVKRRLHNHKFKKLYGKIYDSL